MKEEIKAYNKQLSETDQEICELLAIAIISALSEAEHKLWHAHPVWFINDNPIVGYSKQKKGIRLMFWSGGDFEEEKLHVKGQKFKDASIFYTDASEVNPEDLVRWLQKAREIQWDYKNIVKRKGKLERIIT